VNVETKEQSKAVHAPIFTKEAEEFKQMLFACQKADGNCLSGTGKEC
jgi:hypothetical protein